MVLDLSGEKMPRRKVDLPWAIWLPYDVVGEENIAETLIEAAKVVKPVLYKGIGIETVALQDYARDISFNKMHFSEEDELAKIYGFLDEAFHDMRTYWLIGRLCDECKLSTRLP